MRKLFFLLVTCCFITACRKSHTEYYEDGSLKYKVHLKNGQPDGKAFKYYNDGTLMQESNWIEGVRDGVVSMYYPNGILHGRTEFKFGEETGIKEEYDSLGNLFKRYHIEKSVLDGPHEVYNAKGRIIFEGNFKNGVQSGLWKKYYDEGQLFGKYFIDNGKEIYLKEYNKSGKVVNVKLPVEVSKVPDIGSEFEIGLGFSLENDIYIGVLICSEIHDGIPIDTLDRLESDSLLPILYRPREDLIKGGEICGMLFEIKKESNKILGFSPFTYSIELDSLLN